MGRDQRLTRIVGVAKSKELIYTGKTITANEAQEIGLVNKVLHLTEKEKEETLIETVLENTTTNIKILKIATTTKKK